jgi:hypothetical protein
MSVRNATKLALPKGGNGFKSFCVGGDASGVRHHKRCGNGQAENFDKVN